MMCVFSLFQRLFCNLVEIKSYPSFTIFITDFTLQIYKFALNKVQIITEIALYAVQFPYFG